MEKTTAIIAAIPRAFSLNARADYSRYAMPEGAAGMMRDTWIALGARLNSAAQAVEAEADGQAHKTEAA